MAIVAFIDARTGTESVIAHAVWAATQLGQPLTIVAQEKAREAEPALGFDAYQQMDAQEDMFRELTTRPRQDAPAGDADAITQAQAAARMAKDMGVDRVRTVTSADPVQVFIEQSTDSADLLVVHRGDGAHIADAYLRSRRRMFLLVPDTYAPIESWLIAIDGKPVTGRAVDYLVRQPLLQQLPGTAVFVGNDYQNRVHFRDAVRHLESTGHALRTHELQGAADDVLAAVLAVSPVDLLVMGAYGQGRFRSLIERSTTSRLLASFTGPVLLARG